MGHVRNHTIIVEGADYGDDDKHISAAHAKACEIFPWVSPLSPKVVNGSQTFVIPPDGSKEGWDDSDRGDKRRAEFKKWLIDCDLLIDWVEVYFGGDDAKAVVTEKKEGGTGEIDDHKHNYSHDEE